MISNPAARPSTYSTDQPASSTPLTAGQHYGAVSEDYRQALLLAQAWLQRAGEVGCDPAQQEAVEQAAMLFLGGCDQSQDFTDSFKTLQTYIGALEQGRTLLIESAGFFVQRLGDSGLATAAFYEPGTDRIFINGDYHQAIGGTVKLAAMTVLHEATHARLHTVDHCYSQDEPDTVDVSALAVHAYQTGPEASRNADSVMTFIHVLAHQHADDDASCNFRQQLQSWCREFPCEGLIELKALIEPLRLSTATEDSEPPRCERSGPGVVRSDSSQPGIAWLTAESALADFSLELLQKANPQRLQPQGPEMAPLSSAEKVYALLVPATLKRIVDECLVRPSHESTAPLALALHRIAHAIATEPHGGQRTSLARTALQRLFEPRAGLAEGIAAQHRQAGMIKPCLALLDVLQASLAAAPELRDTARQWLGIAGRKPIGLAKLLEQKGHPGPGGDVRLRFDTLRYQLKQGLPITAPAAALMAPGLYAQNLNEVIRANAGAAKPAKITLSAQHQRQEQVRKDRHARLDKEAHGHLQAHNSRENALAAARSQARAEEAIAAQSRDVQHKLQVAEQRREQRRHDNALMAKQSVAVYEAEVHKQARKRTIEPQGRAVQSSPASHSPALPGASFSLPALAQGPQVDGIPVAALHSIDWGDRRPGNYSDLARCGVAGRVGVSSNSGGTLVNTTFSVPVRVLTSTGLQPQTLSFATSVSSPAVVAHLPFTPRQLAAMPSSGHARGTQATCQAAIVTRVGVGSRGAEVEVVGPAGRLRVAVAQATLHDEKGAWLTLAKAPPSLRR
ncbi:hypothetical protein [Pseudomonas sp. Irchel 3F5]|uniref:hypothetical protein n=1 Tax=Pseudomonas sp. Irchel 3F5 TaxID=2009002 RepID=UPI000BA2EFBC|nr:hypothetical protein [Pseudomonas sp. Irchel 3F5]